MNRSDHVRAGTSPMDTGEQKSIVEETYEPGFSVSSVARKYGISPNQLFEWKRKMEDGALTAVGSEERVIPGSVLNAALERIKHLERLLAQKTEEVEVLKEVVKIGREKNLSLAGRYAKLTTSTERGCSRSWHQQVESF